MLVSHRIQRGYLEKTSDVRLGLRREFAASLRPRGTLTKLLTINFLGRIPGPKGPKGLEHDVEINMYDASIKWDRMRLAYL